MNEKATTLFYIFVRKTVFFVSVVRSNRKGTKGRRTNARKSSLFPRWSVYTEISEIWHGTSDGCSAYSTAARFAGHMARRIST